MNRVMYAAVATAIALAIFARQAPADTPQVPSEPLAIRQVSLFKNGLAFFTGQITCPAQAASFQVALPVAPCHGTFWISYPADLAIASVVARQTESQRLIDAVTIPELLRANPDRKVQLTIGDRNITGVIRHMAPNRTTMERDPRVSSSLPRLSYPCEQPQQGSLLIVETDAGELSIDPRTIAQVVFLDGKAERRFAEGDESPMLHVRLKKPAPGVQIAVSFLAKGAAWTPSYRIDISDASTARLSAQALMVNDACTLKDADVQLVTGFPHLQFADTTSPLALQQDLARFLQALSTRRAESRGIDVTSNVMTQMVTYNGPQEQPSMPVYGAAEIGQVAEDLFLYPAGRLDLGTREVAYVPLFTESVPYQHIYQWDIPDYVNQEGVYEYAKKQPGREEEVWHSIRLTNATQIPWTTAPAETVKNGVILGQDTLSYTPPRAKNTVRITRAIGVKAEQGEFETDRRREAARMYGWTWDLITVKGEFSVVNFQDKAVDLEITKILSGALKTVELEAKIDKIATGLHRMNGLAKLTWNLQLGPGQTKTGAYTYDVYVRR